MHKIGAFLRQLGVATLSLWMMVSLLGCQQQPVNPTIISQNTPITIEFWTLQLLDFKPLLTALFTEYEAQHPGVKIKWVDLPFSEGEKRTLTAMLSPHVPDVVNLNPDFSAILASRGALVNMNDYLTDSQRAAYLPVAWQACTLWSTNAKDPFTFGLPWYLTSKITIYNQQLLQQGGQTTPPKNFDELVALAKTLKANTGYYALMPNIAESGNFLKTLFYNHIPIYDVSGKAIFATPEATAFLARWVMLFQHNWMPSDAITEGPRGAVDRYQSGQLALLMTGANFLNIVKENAPAIYTHTGVAPQFVPLSSKTAEPKTKAVDFATMLLAVPMQSDHPKEAADFAVFMTNAANQLRFAQGAPVLPSTTASLQDAYFQQTDSTDPAAQARQISARQLLNSNTAFQIRPNQKKVNEVMDYYVQLALLGKVSPQEALMTAQDKINGLLGF